MCSRANSIEAIGDAASALIDACICILDATNSSPYERAFAGALTEPVPADWTELLDRLPPDDAPAPKYLTYPNV